MKKFMIIVATAIYVISPIDLVPDIPVVGWADDLIVAFLGMRQITKK
jgi:uncharacterized membrane protein YkvA (DUF1232 family)